jgi:hypothetical protein
VATFLSFWKRTFGCHYLSTIPHISDWHVALGSWQSGGERQTLEHMLLPNGLLLTIYLFFILKKKPQL